MVSSHIMCRHNLVFFLLFIAALYGQYHAVTATTTSPASIQVDDAIIGNTSENYLSVNFDWWPPGEFGWVAGSSALTTNLNDPRLIYLASQLAPAYWRIGGTPEDHVVYNVTGEIAPAASLCNWTDWAGTTCILNASRWDQISQFAEKVGWKLVFGVSAMYGRTNISAPWDSSNAEMLFRYTVEKNYSVYAFEFGNELMEFHDVLPEVLGNDYLRFRALVNKYWPDAQNRPKIIGPDSGSNVNLIETVWVPFLKIAGSVLDAVTYHMYLGYGGNPNLVAELLTPQFLLSLYNQALPPQLVAKEYAPQAEVWAGETAMAYGGGQNGTTNRFASTLWYAYQLGALAAMNQKAFCRQAMLGGNYALVNATSMQPNPDYFTAVLWKHLMGTEALYTPYDFSTPSIRGFTMCSKKRNGAVVLAIINNSPNGTAYNVSFPGIASTVPRNEYRLTASSLSSDVMQLNGNALQLDSQGNLPPLTPLSISASNTPVVIQPLEVRFIEFLGAQISACY